MTDLPLQGAAVEPPKNVPSDHAAARAIVLFADGTGNAFAKQESNIWRLYDALDTARADQIALYIPGVGTSGFKPWALIDGATGLGVPSNVRRLYEFLCWNYRPEDQIFMFGFSRGAFTIRALIGMIDSEGILSNQGVHGIATRPEMRRNVMSAWRAYRSKRRTSVFGEAPTIKVTRLIRDGLLVLRDLVMRYERYATVEKRADQNAHIRFAGVFDTVEAYGVPLEEMRDAIDWAIWPIRFRNRKLSGKVDKARHALSLDDERQTFHPVRFAQDPAKDTPTDRIKEVWFAGVHSDVGGGYPDDGNALVALNWMLGELQGALVFKAASLAAFQQSATSLDATHDSRTGLANFYRYFPRVIGSSPADGNEPVIHHSVIEKMVFGPHRYAPHSLPAKVRVMMPNGSLQSIVGFSAAAIRPSSTAPTPGPQTSGQQAIHAMAALRKPDEAYVRSVHNGVWLRRKAYFLLLIGVLACASLPWTSAVFGVREAAVGEALNEDNVVVLSNNILGAWGGDIAPAAAQIIPSYAQPWANAVVSQPLLSLGVLALTLLMYFVNGVLRDKINDDARCAWFGSGSKGRNQPKQNFLFRCAELLRGRSPFEGKRGFFYWLWFAVSLAAFIIGGFLYLDRVWVSAEVGAGRLCKLNENQQVRQILVGDPQTAEGFAANNPCWDSGLFLEKGAAYEIKLEMVKPFLDRSIVTDVYGFRDSSWRHWLAAPLKRWFSAPYFQPVARIGAEGMTELLLKPVNGEEARLLGSEAEVQASLPSDPCAAVEADPTEIQTISAKLHVQSTQKSRFVAPKSGELFVYLNDALFGSNIFSNLIGISTSDCFYKNNSGLARISVERLSADKQ